MARIFITGSSDGLGLLAAKSLIALRHRVLLHARNDRRAADAIAKVPGAEGVVTGDLESLEETILLAEKMNAFGTFDAIIHNAGLYTASPKQLFAVNTLAPYILTSLIHKPQRLIYLTSGLHKSGMAKLENFRTGVNSINYSDTKLHVMLLCKAVARLWPDVYSNAVNPGWVPTRMGGSGAPDDLQKGYETQVWLAVSNDDKAKVSGRLFFHQNEVRNNPDADNVQLQDQFLKVCKEVTSVVLK